MSPSDSNTNSTVDQLAGAVSGGTSPSDSDLCDWSKGHTVMVIDWPVLVLNDAFLIAALSLVGWIIV